MVPRIEEDGWPIVKIIYGTTIELSEVEQLESRLMDIFRQRGPYATLSDISDLSILHTTALHRRSVAEAADRLASRGAFVAEAVVIRDAISRGLYVGYSWMRSGKKYPSQVFGSGHEALTWAREQLASAGGQ